MILLMQKKNTEPEKHYKIRVNTDYKKKNKEYAGERIQTDYERIFNSDKKL